MPTKQNQPQSWKTSDWVMTKSSVIVEGTLCSEYRNIVTEQIAYEAIEEVKQSLDYRYKPSTSPTNNRILCEKPGDTCYKGVIDGEEVLIIKKGAQIN